MPHPRSFLLCGAFSVLTVSSFAQNPTIGGGTCNSSSLNGVYALTVTGRQTNSKGVFNNLFQANGSASFDGLSKVTITLNTNTLQAIATPLAWSGTYSIQANCVGQVAINSGGSLTLDLLLYGGGTDFLVNGSDATYSYAGSGNTQPATCSATMLAGVYAFNATGFSLNGAAVTGAEDVAGLLQFDGQANVTANFTAFTLGSSSPLNLTGTYSISNCGGSAKLIDSKGNTYTLSFSITAENKTAITNFSATLGLNGVVTLSGAARTVYGQPTAALFGDPLNRLGSLRITRLGGRS